MIPSWRGPAIFPRARPTRAAPCRLPSGSGVSGRTSRPASAPEPATASAFSGPQSAKARNPWLPVLTRTRLNPNNIQRVHQSLHHVVAVAPWNDQLLFPAVRQYVLPQMTGRHPISAWVVDDTGVSEKRTGRGGPAPKGEERAPPAGPKRVRCARFLRS